MRRSLVRALVVPAAALGLTAAMAAAAVSASAADSDSAGSSTLTLSGSYLVRAAESGIVAVPKGFQSISYDNDAQSVSTTFAVTGGDANISVFVGTVEHAGSITIVDALTGRSVVIGDLALDASTDELTGVPQGSQTPIAFLDLAGGQTFTVDGAQQSLSASEVDVDAAGASYLDGALHTHFYVAGQAVGSFSTTFTDTQS